MSSSGGAGNVGARAIGIRDFIGKKERGEQIIVIAAYDALFGRLSEEGGADAILVGDSLGNVIAGHETTLPVTLDQMIYHGASVRRGVHRAMVIIDMPFLTYQINEEQAMRNSGRAIQESGAHAVKLEGDTEEIARSVRAVVRLGVPVMGHIGFTPQSVHALGGFRVQGRDARDADRLVDGAKRLEDAGVFSIVLELIPADVAARITAAVSVPTIGIGAGPTCDGQVLVLHDLLGLNDTFTPRYLKHYAQMAEEVRGAVRRFRDEVVGGQYPDADHSF